jgi:hypothetical protein
MIIIAISPLRDFSMLMPYFHYCRCHYATLMLILPPLILCRHAIIELILATMHTPLRCR